MDYQPSYGREWISNDRGRPGRRRGHGELIRDSFLLDEELDQDIESHNPLLIVDFDRDDLLNVRITLELDTEKSTGRDELQPKILRLITQYIAVRLTTSIGHVIKVCYILTGSMRSSPQYIKQNQDNFHQTADLPASLLLRLK